MLYEIAAELSRSLATTTGSNLHAAAHFIIAFPLCIAKGAVKEVVGKALGDSKLETEALLHPCGGNRRQPWSLR